MAIGEDEPMSDPPPQQQQTTPTKPRRRFVPQVVETSVKSNRQAPAGDPAQVDDDGSKNNTEDATLSTARKGTMRDASVQADIEMPDAPRSPAPKRRFVPVPIETTFDSYRVNNSRRPGPTAELTPEPSPRTLSPPPEEKLPLPEGEKKPKVRRRFAPQLIETSRRAKRQGQDGPATKPTDKTDITPGTNHIYVPKSKRKDASRSSMAVVTGPAILSESNSGDGSPSSNYLHPRRQASMKPHPNTRRSTRNNSFHPDLDTIVSDGNSSGGSDEETAEVPRPALQSGRASRMSDRSDGSSWSSRNYHLRERRESCDEDFSGYLLAVAAREALKQREMEQAMSAFPNALQLEGVEHFYMREGSDDEHQSRHGTSNLIRRKSTDPGWAVNEMRQHAEKLSVFRKESRMSLDSFEDADMGPPPADPYWTTNAPRPASSQGKPIGEVTMPFIRPTPAEAVRENRMLYTRTPSPPSYSAGESRMPFIRSVTPNNVPADVGFSNTGFGNTPFSRPFGKPFGLPDSEADDAALRRMRKTASPPMLGGDLKFRICPSPKVTKLEPDHPYQAYAKVEAKPQDTTGKTGLWGGYCVAKTEEPAPVEDTGRSKGGLWGGFCVAKDNEATRYILQPPALLATPLPPSTPMDPFSAAFSMTPLSPSQLHSTSGSASQDSNEEPLPAHVSGRKSGVASPNKRHSAGKSKGLHLLSGLDERLKKEKARKDLEERIASEFTDAFVTQVYNYLSLGYPATARAFDEELAKISGIPICDLREGDEEAMFELSSEGERKAVTGGKVKGFMLEMKYQDGDEGEREREGCPRWRALRLYIREWARQHPDLGADGNMLAWGVRERRGSWAI